jgi:hypothetical protein
MRYKSANEQIKKTYSWSGKNFRNEKNGPIELKQINIQCFIKVPFFEHSNRRNGMMLNC